MLVMYMLAKNGWYLGVNGWINHFISIMNERLRSSIVVVYIPDVMIAACVIFDVMEWMIL